MEIANVIPKTLAQAIANFRAHPNLGLKDLGIEEEGINTSVSLESYFAEVENDVKHTARIGAPFVSPEDYIEFAEFKTMQQMYNLRSPISHTRGGTSWPPFSPSILQV
jgi:hypothetical protein